MAQQSAFSSHPGQTSPWSSCLLPPVSSALHLPLQTLQQPHITLRVTPGSLSVLQGSETVFCLSLALSPHFPFGQLCSSLCLLLSSQSLIPQHHSCPRTFALAGTSSSDTCMELPQLSQMFLVGPLPLPDFVSLWCLSHLTNVSSLLPQLECQLMTAEGSGCLSPAVSLCP